MTHPKKGIYYKRHRINTLKRYVYPFLEEIGKLEKEIEEIEKLVPKTRVCLRKREMLLPETCLDIEKNQLEKVKFDG